MKRIISFMCIMLLAVVSITACSSSNTENDSLSLSEAVEQPESLEQENMAELRQEENPVSEERENQSGNNIMTEKNGDVLVVYFSATGTTKMLAEYAADALSADLYEIVPEEPYTSDDLNYNDSSSRTSIEMNDSESRPAISGSIENMEQYKTIFLGYPIWWGEAPHIINTFMESYDFSGKTIVPFCTSGGSGIGSSARNLHGLCADDVIWLDGSRLSSSASREDMVEWINGLGLDIEAE